MPPVLPTCREKGAAPVLAPLGPSLCPTALSCPQAALANFASRKTGSRTSLAEKHS